MFYVGIALINQTLMAHARRSTVDAQHLIGNLCVSVAPELTRTRSSN
jgi:hypothetical protein